MRQAKDTCSIEELLERFSKQLGLGERFPRAYRVLLLESLLALISHARRKFSEHYAPGFQLVNPKAPVALVGYTPGRSHGENAWRALKQTPNPSPPLSRLEVCHEAAAFSGLRSRIDQMADHAGLLEHLSLSSLSDRAAVAMTSRWVFPVFENGQDYTLNPQACQRNGWLAKRCSEHLKDLFATCSDLQAAVFLGNGKSAIKALELHQSLADTPQRVEVYVLPHPSGANNVRITEFLSKTQTLASIRS
ncbi:MAG: hypothetical protein AB8B70_11580 [Prochlorococcus sp.]